MRYIFTVFIVAGFIGCSVAEKPAVETKPIVQKKTKILIKDLVTIPQDVEFYTKDLNVSKLYSVQKQYEKSYFSVWNINTSPHTLEDVKWPFRYFPKAKNYGENLLPVKDDFFTKMYKKSNYNNYNSLNKKALTLNYSHIRALPTSKPLLHDPSLAGEGFPFDYLQNSSIHANAPLLVSHYSADKQWVFVFSNITYGWLKTSEIAFISDAHASQWKNAKQVMITKEGFSLYNEHEEALFDTRIGMMFALVGEDEASYTVLTVSSYKNNQALFNKSILPKTAASKEFLVLNKTNLSKIIKEVSKTNYGWGGIYGQRDCSSTLMDLYVPFGIYLPRNSSKQSKIGEVINLKKLNDLDKIQFIKEEAIPFQTLLYRKGHIVLYVGTFKDQIIVFQNVWGIRTKKDAEEGRFIIGRPIFSTLKLGAELEDYDESAELLRNIESMNTLTR